MQVQLYVDFFFFQEIYLKKFWRFSTTWKKLVLEPHNLEILKILRKKDMSWMHKIYVDSAAAAAAKSLQLCPTLCDPRDSSPSGSPIPGILQARTLEWVAISFSNAWKWKVKVKSFSRIWLLATPSLFYLLLPYNICKSIRKSKKIIKTYMNITGCTWHQSVWRNISKYKDVVLNFNYIKSTLVHTVLLS